METSGLQNRLSHSVCVKCLIGSRDQISVEQQYCLPTGQ